MTPHEEPWVRNLGPASTTRAPGPPERRISVCVVSYNTADLLDQCLASVFRYVVPLGAEVIVVDNGSIDGSTRIVRERFSEAQIIENATNRYFTGAVNQAVAAARAEYLLLLNSDAYFIDDSVRTLVAFMDSHADCAAAEGLTLEPRVERPILTARRYSSGRREVVRFGFLGRPLRSRPFFRRMHYPDRSPHETWPVEVACNCFMLVRRSVFQQMGGADESMLLYYSEDDWAHGFQALGYRSYHVGSARVCHVGKGSTARISPVVVEAIYFHDRFAYLKKHHGLASALWATGMIMVRRNVVRGMRVVAAWRRLPRRAPALRGSALPSGATGRRRGASAPIPPSCSSGRA